MSKFDNAKLGHADRRAVKTGVNPLTKMIVRSSDAPVVAVITAPGLSRRMARLSYGSQNCPLPGNHGSLSLLMKDGASERDRR